MKLENSFATSLNTVLLLLFSNAQCQASDSAYRPLGASCVDYTIPVSPNASGAIFNEASKWLDDCGLSQFTANRGGRDPLASPVFSAGSQQLNGSFTIGATFCTPTNPQNNHSKTVILASHGLGFDRSLVSPVSEWPVIDSCLGIGILPLIRKNITLLNLP